MKTIQPRHQKRRESRAPETGIATAHGNKITDISPARRMSPVAGVCLAAALLVGLLIGPAPRAKADFTYENKITTDTNQAGGSLNHSEQTHVDDAGEWILYQRRANANIYQNIHNPDQFQAKIHTVPINYWDGEAFRPIDLAIKELSDGAYKYVMSAAPYQIYLPEFLNSPIKLMSRGKRYEFTLEEMSYNAGEDYLGRPYPASAETGAEKVIYPEAFENIDLEYNLKTWGLKQFFVLKEKPTAPAGHLTDPTLDFTEIIDAGDLKMHVDGAPAPDNFATDKPIEFVDVAGGETVFILPAPYAIDANGEIIQIRYEVQTRGDRVRIHTQTPYAWLNDPERAYPVRIDPSPETLTAGYSVILIAGATWDTGYISSGEWNGDSYRTGIDFDTTAIPDEATIDKVELTLFIDEEDTPLNNDVGNMTKKAYTYHVTDSDEAGFNADVDGNEYLSDSGGFAGLGSHTVELLPAAATDLQNQLDADWFSVGFTGTTETNDIYRDGHAVGEANPPQLIVTYSGVVETSTTKSPGTVAMVLDSTLCGTLDKDWKNMPNAVSSNDLYASFEDKNFDAGEISKRLDLTNFAFAIPDGATIEGVEVEIERYASAGGVQDQVVHLMLAGSPDTTENKALASTAWPTSDPNSYVSYGGATDKWGIAGLSESNVENSGFGVSLCVEATTNDADADVDHVQVTVHYTPPGIILADHAAGQQSSAFFNNSAVTGAQLFGFKLTNNTAGTLTVDQLVFQLSAVTGIAQGDFANLAIYVDDDNDGEIETGETTTKGGSGVVNAGVSTITFSTDFDVGAGATVNYILTGDVSSLASGDTVTIDLGTSDITLTSFTVLGSAAASVTHFFCDTVTFSYRRPIVIDHTKVGLDNTGTLPATGFPVLVSLSGDWLKTTAVDPTNGRIQSAIGGDIIFRESDGVTHLYHEIEEYNPNTGTLVAWVRIDSLSKSADTTIYMYYGNPCIDFSTEDPGNVWDASFQGVWHLEEQVTDDGTTGIHDDSTSKGNDGAQDYNGPIAGKISGAQDFDGTDDYVNFGTGINSPVGTANAVTISAWVRNDNLLATKRERYVDLDDGVVLRHDGIAGLGELHFYIRTGGGTSRHLRVDSVLMTNDTWYHVAGTWDGTTQRVFLNGDEKLSQTPGGTLDTPSGNGKISNPIEALDGIIDEARVSSTPRDADWIRTEYNNQVWPNTASTPSPLPNPNPGGGFLTAGNEESGPATAVTLASFTAKGQSSYVLVEWETAQELNHMGFYLYRARSPWGPFTRLTDKLISGLTSSVVGRAYTFEDKDVTPGEIYYYQLEDIDIYGKKTVHGPVSVDWDGDGLPDDWEIAHGLDPGFDDADLDSDGDALTNWEEYLHGTDPFNPDTDGDGILDGEDRETDSDSQGGVRTLSPGVYILAADETGTTLELRTDSFDFTILEAEGQEFERLRIPDYIHGFTPEVGKPELPLKGILVDIPQGNSATLTVLQTEEEFHTGYRIYPVPENVVDEQDQLAHVGETFVIADAAYNVDAFYPEAPALLGKEYLFRGQQKQQIFFHPLTFNPATGEIRHYRRIRVRVDYAVGEWAKAAGPEPTIWSPSVSDEGYEDFSSFVKMAFLTPSMMVNPIASVVSSAAILVRAIWVPPSAATTPAYKILLVEDGIYRLTKTWLEANGVDVSTFDLSEVRIYHLGQEIAIYVYDENGDDLFDPEDSIYFYGRAVEESYAKYTTDNVYWLTTAGGVGAPKRMAAVDGTPVSDNFASTHSFAVHHEEDREYWARAPGGDELDRYFFQPYVVGADVDYFPPPGDPDPGDPVSFDLFLPGVPVNGKGILKIMMAGTWDTDHQVAVSLNGTPLGTYSWSGIAFEEVTIEGVDLQDGNNTVTLECLTGEDNIAVDWFEVTYPRRFAASADLLTFSHDTGYRYQVTGFSGIDLLAFDITSPADVEQVINFATIDTGGPGPYTLDFEPSSGSGERTYLVLTADQVLAPDAIIEDEYKNLADPAIGADYILITHRDLGWDGSGDPYLWLSELTALRQAQGLRVRVVDVEDIFDEFSYGIEGPEGIRDFLTYAYSSWTPPAPQYVLLVGDSSRNPKNNPNPWFGLDTVTTYLPTYLTVTEHMGETAATDEWFARVSGDDAIADLYIGRLPAKSTDEATAMVNKILAYEGSLNTKSWEKDVLLLADDQGDGPEYEYEAVFETMNNDAAALLPAAMNDPITGYLNDYGNADVLKAEILAEINSGTLIVNYSGHSSIQRLADPNIFKLNTPEDLAALTNSNMYPFFIGMGCLSGNFVYPEGWNYPSLAEALMRAEDKGAAAALMSTGLTTTGGQHILNTALFDVVFNQDVRVLGQAVSVAKQTLMANGGSQYDEVNETFLLFGDPAMTLKVPLPQRPAGLSAQGNGNAVDLSWDEATDCNSGPVAGYNLYRSTTPGGTYTQVNTSLITETQYDDISVVAGTTYYYVVTSVDADGDESAQSQEANGGTQSANSSGGGGGGCFIDSVAAE